MIYEFTTSQSSKELYSSGTEHVGIPALLGTFGRDVDSRKNVSDPNSLMKQFKWRIRIARPLGCRIRITAKRRFH
jgi:hypothetical protein